MTKVNKPQNLILATSTFPRWRNDNVPRFVQDFAVALSASFRRTHVLAPHYVGAKRNERLAPGILIRRFRYFLPARHQDIVYNGGGATKVKKSPLYAFKLLSYCVSLTAGILTMRRRLGKDSIINAHWLIPQGVIALVAGRLLSTKVVITIHGGDVYTFNGKVMRTIKAWALRRADAVVVNSTATRAACQALYPGRDYPIIPMGTDLTRFPIKKPGRQPKKNRPLHVLFVGRLVPEKGIMYLCRAILQLTKRGVPVKLTIVGDGPQLATVQAFAARHGLEQQIVLEGWQSHTALPKKYARADVLVSPSVEHKNGWQEAFGLVLVEALACGTPVIATSTGGTQDIVQEGRTGFVVPQKNAEALADRLEYVYNNPKDSAKIGLSGAAFVRKTFGWDSTQKRYAQVFEDLI